MLFVLAVSCYAADAIMSSKEDFGSHYEYFIAGTMLTDESDSFINVLNPNTQKARVEVTMFFKKNDSASFTDYINPRSVRDFNIASRLSGDINSQKNTGVKIVSDIPLAVSHTVYDTAYSAGFGSAAVLKPSQSWYFAEGYSSEKNRSFLFFTNPNVKETIASVTLYYAGGQKKSFNVDLKSESCIRLDLKEHSMPDKAFGIKVTSPEPIIAESFNMNREFKTGSGGAGNTKPAKKWFFAEGYTEDKFVDATFSDETEPYVREYLSMVNPSETPANIIVWHQYADGKESSFDVELAAHNSASVILNNRADSTSKFSTVVESDVEIIAELSHHDKKYSAGHGGLGSDIPRRDIYFTDGFVNSLTRDYLALFNPGKNSANLNITLYYEDGTTHNFARTVGSMIRNTIDLHTEATPNERFGLKIVSDNPIFAQHVVLDKSHSAGRSSFGAGHHSQLVVDDVAQELVADDDSVDEVVSDINIIQSEMVDISKFGGVLGELNAAKKVEYEVDGSTVVVWVFGYENQGDSEDGLSAVLSGKLFTLMERTPKDIYSTEAFYLITDKSEGFSWNSMNNVFVVLSSRGDMESALNISKEIIDNNPVEERRFSKLLLAILVVLIIIIMFRSISGRSKSEVSTKSDSKKANNKFDDDYLEDSSDLVIKRAKTVKPVETSSAKKKNKGSKSRLSNKKAVKKSSSKKIKKSVEKPIVKDVNEINTDIKKEIKQEKKEIKLAKRQAKKAKKDFDKMLEASAQAKKKPKQKTSPKTKPAKKKSSSKDKETITKIVKDASKNSGKTAHKKNKKDTNPDALKKVVEYDELIKEIPSYEDVFQMKNRDQDIIKSK